MDVFQFEAIVKTEGLSRRYIDHICRLTSELVCPKCRCSHTRRIEERNRYRCCGCGFRFKRYSGRWFGEINIPARTWLWIIKLFEMELTATKIAEETGLSYPTILKAVRTIRKAIAASTDHGMEILLKSGGHRKIPVFRSIDETGGQTRMVPLPDKHIRILERLDNGHLICTDITINDKSLECGGIWHNIVDYGRGSPHFRIYLAYPKGFWIHIKEQLRKYHGVKDENLTLCILEMEFRHNNWHKTLFDTLVKSLCRFIPREYYDRSNQRDLEPSNDIPL